MAEGIRPREATLAAMAVPLWSYLGRTLWRLAALHARFENGTLAPASDRGAARQPISARPRTVRRPPSIPRGPVLLQYYLVHFVAPLRELVDDPEMRALLAAAPQAGRPLWRKLTTDPLPEVLRLPPKPPRPAAEPEAASVAPAAPPEPPPAAPPRRRPASAAKPPPYLPAWPPPLWGA
jgi:hypothetical protein